MQKVITVTLNLSKTSINLDDQFSELDLPSVNNLLEEGYKVKNTFIESPKNSNNYIAIVFILEKH